MHTDAGRTRLTMKRFRDNSKHARKRWKKGKKEFRRD